LKCLLGVLPSVFFLYRPVVVADREALAVEDGSESFKLELEVGSRRNIFMFTIC
jgi:hypothetical protein